MTNVTRLDLVENDETLIRDSIGGPAPEFSLSLRDGSCWHLNADIVLRPWLDAFAAIMEMDGGPPRESPSLSYALHSNHPRQLHFLTSRKIPNIRPGSGWERTELKSLGIWSHKEAANMLCELKYLGPSDLENGRSPLEIVVMSNALYPIHWHSIRLGGLPFHAALITHQGRGVLLAARGGTGKSTCCRRLPDGWNALCDDEALAVRDQGGRYRVHPFPTWSDHLYQHSPKTWNVQQAVPLCGLFFMAQSAVDEAVAIGQGEALALINASVLQQACQRYLQKTSLAFQRNFRQRVFANSCRLVRSVPAFRLGVSRNGRFWEKIAQALGW